MFSDVLAGSDEITLIKDDDDKKMPAAVPPAISTPPTDITLGTTRTSTVTPGMIRSSLKAPFHAHDPVLEDARLQWYPIKTMSVTKDENGDKIVAFVCCLPSGTDPTEVYWSIQGDLDILKIQVGMPSAMLSPVAIHRH